MPKLSSIELLEVTEEAVGGQEFSEKHKALLEKSRELKRLEITVRQNEETLTKFKALNAEQEKDVEHVRQREKLLRKIESIKKKLPWLKYDIRKRRKWQSKIKMKLQN